jgi:hypothetical protein
MATESTDPIERWTAKRRVTLVVSILKGETSVAEAVFLPHPVGPSDVPCKPLR